MRALDDFATDARRRSRRAIWNSFRTVSARLAVARHTPASRARFATVSRPSVRTGRLESRRAMASRNDVSVAALTGVMVFLRQVARQRVVSARCRRSVRRAATAASLDWQEAHRPRRSMLSREPGAG